MNNPLLSPYDGNLDTIRFQAIQLSDYKPAFDQAIEQAKSEIEAIKNNPTPPTFENTIAAFERSGELVNAISTIFFNLNSANTSDEMQKLAQEISPLLTAYSNEIQLDEVLFARIKAARTATNSSELDAESAYLLEKIYRSFVRNGALLSETDKTTLKSINTELSKLTLKFSENLLKDSNSFELWITDSS
jgi:Zn-dependent oligopeptidase